MYYSGLLQPFDELTDMSMKHLTKPLLSFKKDEASCFPLCGECFEGKRCQGCEKCMDKENSTKHECKRCYDVVIDGFLGGQREACLDKTHHDRCEICYNEKVRLQQEKERSAQAKLLRKMSLAALGNEL